MHLPLQTRARVICEVLTQTAALDALIVGNDLTILAATRNYSHAAGKRCYKNSNSTRVLASPTSILVEKPRQAYQCRVCEGHQSCIFSKPVLVSPIMLTGRTPIGVLVLVATHPSIEQMFLTTPFDDLSASLNEVSHLLALLLDPKQTTDYKEWITTLAKCLDILTGRPGLIIDDDTGMITLSPRLLQLVSIETSLEVRNGPSTHADERPASRTGTFFTLNNRRSDISLLLPGVNASLTGYRVHLPEISSTQYKPYNKQSPFDLIIGKTPGILAVKELSARIAVSDLPVLIQGETGTGKELLARAIHRASPRRDKALVAVNMAAIPEHLFESEFFGYEEGSFTGAKRGGKPGKIELANGGTLFLDEVAEMPVSQQAKLLRVLETGYVERLGATRAKPIDIRIIAATNRNPEELIANGMFRKDLYYRLSAVTITIPPLRDRKEDIPLLVEYFLELCFEKYGLKKHMHPDTMRCLLEYEWPGNVRELRNTIEYAYCISDKLIMPHCLPKEKLRIGESIRLQSTYNHTDFDLRKHELETIERALAQFGTSVQGKRAAAKALGISLATLYRRLKQHSPNGNRSNHLSGTHEPSARQIVTNR